MRAMEYGKHSNMNNTQKRITKHAWYRNHGLSLTLIFQNPEKITSKTRVIVEIPPFPKIPKNQIQDPTKIGK